MTLRRRVLLATLALGLLPIACSIGGPAPSSGGPRPGGSTASATASISATSAATPGARGPSPVGDRADPAPTAGSAQPTMAAPIVSPAPGASATPSRVYGCPSGPCPRNLQYGVNGCTCAGQVYDESGVSAAFCCGDGFSDSPCPESVAAESALLSEFGSTEEEVEDQLVTIELKGWPVRVHVKAEAAFRRAAERLEGLGYEIREPIESFNWRVVEGSNVLSPHAFGIAVDVNPTANPCCGVTQWCRCYNAGITDMPPDFVQAFKDAGFEWGGDWADHPDPMHFEWIGWR